MAETHHSLLTRMAGSDNEAADQAIGVALLADDGRRARELVGALLVRGTDQAVCYVVRAYHRLDPGSQGALLARCPGISGALRLATRNEASQARRNTIAIVSTCGRSNLAYLLVPLLHDDVPTVRAEAGRAIKFLAEKLARSLPTEPPGSRAAPKGGIDDELRHFCVALELALESFASHLRTEVVEAAMYLAAHLPKPLWARMTGSGGRSGAAAMEILRRTSGTAFAGFAFRAFTSDELVRPAAKMIGAATSTDFMRAWLSFAWYRFDRVCQKHLAWIKEFRWVAQDAKALLDSPGPLQAAFVDVLIATSIPMAEKLRLLGCLLTSSDFSVQEHVVATLIRLDDPAATSLVARAVSLGRAMGFSSRAAEMARGHVNVPALEGGTKREKQDSVKGDAREVEAEQGFAMFWSSWPRLNGPSRQEAASHLQRSDHRFANRVLAKLMSPISRDRVRAMSVMREAKLSPPFADHVFPLCENPDATVRAAAVAALADMPGRRAEHKLIEALDDGDERVQANAIEALETINLRNLPELIESKLCSENNRIRANAIKAILRPQCTMALHTLIAMLDHPNSQFRRSALWAISQVMPLHVLAKVDNLANDDPDPEVKAMARHAVDEMVAYWKGRTKPEGQPVEAGV